MQEHAEEKQNKSNHIAGNRTFQTGAKNVNRQERSTELRSNLHSCTLKKKKKSHYSTASLTILQEKRSIHMQGNRFVTCRDFSKHSHIHWPGATCLAQHFSDLTKECDI